MGQRHVSVLLAARLQFRLSEFEQALASGDTPRAEREDDELNSNWTQFGHIARAAHYPLCDKIASHVASIQSGIRGTTPNQNLQDQVHQLGTLLRQLAS